MTDAIKWQEPWFPDDESRALFKYDALRGIVATADGSTILSVKTKPGTGNLGCIYAQDVATGTERILADPSTLIPSGTSLSPEEKALRERMRVSGTGITGFVTTPDGMHAYFSLGGGLFELDVTSGATRRIPAVEPVMDVMPNADGSHIAYVSHGSLHVVSNDGTKDVLLAAPESETVSYGLADFIGAEELDRFEGYWWSPGGDALLVARTDVGEVKTVYSTDPSDPSAVPVPMRYPMTGTPNPRVTLEIMKLDGTRIPVELDPEEDPYVARVHWSAAGNPLVEVLNRSQTRARILSIDPATGKTSLKREITDAAWVDTFNGVPQLTPRGELVTIEPVRGYDRLLIDGVPKTPDGMNVNSVSSVGASGIMCTVTTDDPNSTQIATVTANGVTMLTAGTGVRQAYSNGRTTVIREATMATGDVTLNVLQDGKKLSPLKSEQKPLAFAPNVELLTVGKRKLSCALIRPRGYTPSMGPLPVLLCPYGGPHGQQVKAYQRMYLTAQWFADHGFAVLVTDGRGMAGRGPSWARSVKNDLATPVLDDQIDALHAVAKLHPELDLTKVAIRGWSFGGYLAALAVLRRPDIIKAAIAGAPVTDWRLYDTCYSERYMGDPEKNKAAYDATSLIAMASRLENPLMIIHGLADDNVLPANTLQLSTALLHAGRLHTVLPLTGGVTHMVSGRDVEIAMYEMQVAFIKEALGIGVAQKKIAPPPAPKARSL